jgi:hypothetical protein
MSLKMIFQSMKQEGFLIWKLEEYLLKKGLTDEEHSHKFISPSGMHYCIRSILYRILGEHKDCSPNTRLKRIFDTGSAIHIQIQGYLLAALIIVMDEAPIFSKLWGVMGHTDGIIALDKFSLGILEIKSMNTNEFSRLKAPKLEHILQANSYMFFTELLRRRINKAKNKLQFKLIRRKILKEYEAAMRTFIVKDGRKYTAEQKIQHGLDCMSKLVDILYKCQKPIKTICFYYYDKNTSEHKEFDVYWDNATIKQVKARCNEINGWKKKKKLPPRPVEANGKSCGMCRNCDYKTVCYH